MRGGQVEHAARTRGHASVVTGPVGSQLRVTVDTNVVIDALERARPAAVEIFARARAGEIDIAFSTRLEYELQRHTLHEVHALIARDVGALGTTARYGFSTYGGGDTWAADPRPAPAPLTSSWRLDFGRLGIDTVLGGGDEDLSLPTLEPLGKFGAIDSDHLEAHRRAGRDVFVTSDHNLIAAARERGIDAATPEELIERLGRRAERDSK